MSLSNTAWSFDGVYRGGYALGFDGHSSTATIQAWPALNGVRDDLTIGMAVHPHSVHQQAVQVSRQKPLT